MKERLSITIDPDLLEKIEKISKQEKISRSRIITEALKLWEQKKIENLMRKGYLESAKEDKEFAKLSFEAQREILP